MDQSKIAAEVAEIAARGIPENASNIARNMTDLIELQKPELETMDPKRRAELEKMWRDYYHIFNTAANRYRDLASIAFRGLDAITTYEDIPSDSERQESSGHSAQPLEPPPERSSPDESGHLRAKEGP